MSDTLTPAPSVEELEEMIAELEQYRTRIFDETIAVAKRAKLPQKLVTAQLEQNPDVLKIDDALVKLRASINASRAASL